MFKLPLPACLLPLSRLSSAFRLYAIDLLGTGLSGELRQHAGLPLLSLVAQPGACWPAGGTRQGKISFCSLSLLLPRPISPCHRPTHPPTLLPRTAAVPCPHPRGGRALFCRLAGRVAAGAGAGQDGAHG